MRLSCVEVEQDALHRRISGKELLHGGVGGAQIAFSTGIFAAGWYSMSHTAVAVSAKSELAPGTWLSQALRWWAVPMPSAP
ncbi:MAG: hypothetical protein H7201_09425 [Candidatus Saccharibacteria bacterium]|nr:hypothetical protein [Microbacteriaceae bacterium]